MEAAATQQHAHQNTVSHCLFAYYTLGYSKQRLAHVFNKSERTLINWIKTYEQTGVFQRAKATPTKRFWVELREWLLTYYHEHPLSYLDEAQHAFTRAHHVAISKTSVSWNGVHCTREQDDFRFGEELNHVDWNYQNLVFLDEVSFDNRRMIRKRGYSLQWKKLAIRGDFERMPRISVLASLVSMEYSTTTTLTAPSTELNSQSVAKT
ncbi:hypothetical protein PHMEG_00010285 [Phytophthora megakarya]|uniref:Transposase n=1 Tax=Phytophthora megakarya TaxID=4795 RepID=A0A225WG25_9STRA|nr:hypothetical protein PHMEG_00010285 [Phytophthora megakarya]